MTGFWRSDDVLEPVAFAGKTAFFGAGMPAWNFHVFTAKWEGYQLPVGWNRCRGVRVKFFGYVQGVDFPKIHPERRQR